MILLIITSSVILEVPFCSGENNPNRPSFKLLETFDITYYLFSCFFAFSTMFFIKSIVSIGRSFDDIKNLSPIKKSVIIFNKKFLLNTFYSITFSLFVIFFFISLNHSFHFHFSVFFQRCL